MGGLTLESALLAPIALVLVALLSVGFASRPASAVPLLLLLEMPNATFVTPGVTVGRIHVYPEDILTVALAAATLLRIQQRGHGKRSTWQLVVLLAILLLGMARGAAAFGLQTSVVEAREMLYMLTTAIFFSTVRVTPQLIRVIRNWFLLASAMLMLVAINFWFQHGFGTYALTGSRTLDGTQALIILETTIITVLFPPFRAPVLRLVIPLVGVVVVLLSVQRTVWAAGLVAAAVFLVVRSKNRESKSKAGPRLLVVAAAFAVVLLVVAGPSGVTSDLTAGYQQTGTSQNSTFSWRLQGWSILINRQITGPRADLVVGSPSGTGYARVIDESTVTVAPHSEYVSALDEIGIIGVALLVWVYVTALRKSRRRLRSPSAFVGNAAVLFIALLALQLTFFVGYSQGALVGLMLGLACGFVHGSDQDSSVDRSQQFMPAPTQRP